jgi:hypothetical protein
MKREPSRYLFTIDAAFEAALALVLLVGAATGTLDAGDFPHPVGVSLIVLAGVVLALAAVVISSGRIALAVLAAGNAATAAGAVIWLLAADGFSAAGGWLVAATAAMLSALAGAQFASR